MCTPMSPWKGRLRSHHATPISLPRRKLPSQTKNPEVKEDLQTSKKKVAPKKTARGRPPGAAAQQPRARLRQSSQLAGRDSEHPVVIDDDVNGEHKSRADQSAIMPLRRSPRFHVEDKSLGKSLLPPNRQETSANKKTKTAHRKDKNQESQKRNRGSAALPPRKGDKRELKPNHKVQTGKRTRGTERRLSSKKQRCQDHTPLPEYCQEIAPRNELRKSTHRRVEKGPSIEVKLKVGDERSTNIDENINMPSGTEREGMGNFHGSDDWTEEQDMALRKAYFSARPSPHFWKRVSKMVPGKSAEDCFNRTYADLSTPTPIAPRPRASKVRQLLQKHCRYDQAQEADHFSIFEGSPSALRLNLSFEDSPGTPHSYMNSDSLGKHSGSSSARKKPFSRLRIKPSEPSPEVLKPIKNIILHEKYINQLARREGTKRPRRRAPARSKAADSGKSLSEQQAGSVKAAKNALISEATDFISSFKWLQANSLAHVVENSEDEIECYASDCSHDDKE